MSAVGWSEGIGIHGMRMAALWEKETWRVLGGGALSIAMASYYASYYT